MQRVPTGDSLHIKFQVIPTIGFRVIVVGSWVTFWVGFTHPLFTPKKSRFLLGRAWSRPETPLHSVPTRRKNLVFTIFWHRILGWIGLLINAGIPPKFKLLDTKTEQCEYGIY